MAAAPDGAPAPLPIPPNFPVAWTAPGDPQMFWTQERMHYPQPITPLSFSFVFDQGFNHGAEFYSMPVRAASRRFNSYVYWSVHPVVPPEQMAELGAQSEAKLTAAIGRLQQLWDEEWLPKVKEHLAYWDSYDLKAASLADLSALLDETEQRAQTVWGIHFELVFPVYLVMSLYEEMFTDLFGEDAKFDAYRLIQGYGNKSVELDHALWDLSRVALKTPAVAAAISGGDPSTVASQLGGVPGSAEFVAALHTFLETYGRRVTQLELSMASWIEDPAPAMRTLKGYLAQPDRDLGADLQAQADERDRLYAERMAQIKDYPEPVQAQFNGLLAAARIANPISESHTFYIDYGVVHRVRQVVMEIGRRLAPAGAFDVAGDVMYLTLDELRAAIANPAADCRKVIADRKAEIAHYSGIPAPAVIGTLPPGPPPNDPFGRAIAKLFGMGPHRESEAGTVAGSPGSPGVVRGTVRIISGLDEADRLQPGDILVSATTTPPWTPLFAIAGAVVTDTGGILSHCAVVAREYGIPAVVGTVTGTAVLKDGQQVEVDGAAGTVRVL